MERIVPYLLCVIFLAVMYGLMRLALFLSKAAARRSVYQSGVYTAKTVHTLFLAQFSERNVLSDAFLPRKTASDVVYEKCDHILFLDGALAIVTICREDGVINNLSFGETWYSRVRTKLGTEKELIFENPITAGERKKQALTKILENANCRFRIPVHHIVIFPSRRVRFSLPRQEEIMSPPEALRRLTEMNKTVRFTKEQKKAIKKAVKHFSLTNSQVEKIQIKKQKAQSKKLAAMAKAKKAPSKKQPTPVKKRVPTAHAPTAKNAQTQRPVQPMQKPTVSAPKSTPTVSHMQKQQPMRKPHPQALPKTAQTPARKMPATQKPTGTRPNPPSATKRGNPRHR